MWELGFGLDVGFGFRAIARTGLRFNTHIFRQLFPSHFQAEYRRCGECWHYLQHAVEVLQELAYVGYGGPLLQLLQPLRRVGAVNYLRHNQLWHLRRTQKMKSYSIRRRCVFHITCVPRWNACWTRGRSWIFFLCPASSRLVPKAPFSNQWKKMITYLSDWQMTNDEKW